MSLEVLQFDLGRAFRGGGDLADDPRLLAGTLVFAVGYLILYPGLGNWKGVLPGYEDGWTQTKEWDKEMAKADAKFGPIFAKLAAMPVEEVAKDPQAFKIKCCAPTSCMTWALR